jgi:hypothetical protein
MAAHKLGLGGLGRRQIDLPLTTIILAGFKPPSLVHHHAVWRQGRQKLFLCDFMRPQSVLKTV